MILGQRHSSLASRSPQNAPRRAPTTTRPAQWRARQVARYQPGGSTVEVAEQEQQLQRDGAGAATDAETQQQRGSAARAAVQAADQRAEAAGARRAAGESERPAVLRNIVFVSSEAAPWSKTGGLGDVVGSLPAALAARGHRVMVVAPRYADYEDTADTGVTAELLGHAEVTYHHRRRRGVDWVFVDHPSYKRPAGLYADAHGPYGDNQFRFTLLSLAGCEAPLLVPMPPAGAADELNGRPEASENGGSGSGGNGGGSGGEWSIYGQDITFIANDWHSALVPVYLAAKYRPHGVFTGARSVLAIHNLRHQGVFPPHTFNDLGLPPHWYGAVEFQYPPHQRQGSYAEEGRSVNHLKAGISTADRLVTVSPGYADEVTTLLGGWGLDGLLGGRRPVLNGIVNGIDDDEWNPETDTHIAANYGPDNLKAGKAANKAALQRELGLPEDPDAPLLAFIGRLDNQKGADLVLQAAPWLMAQGCQLVCLGTGAPDLEAGLRWLEATFPEQARGWVGFNVAMSHKITAGADILLMPSRFEPCGLNQLYAMRYGTVPVAHKTGGLRDTVIDFNPFATPPTGTGWTFESFDAGGLMHAAGLAISTYRKHPRDFEGLQRRGMARDSSWDGAARTYEEVFTWAHVDPPYCK